MLSIYKVFSGAYSMEYSNNEYSHEAAKYEFNRLIIERLGKMPQEYEYLLTEDVNKSRLGILYRINNND